MRPSARIFDLWTTRYSVSLPLPPHLTRKWPYSLVCVLAVMVHTFHWFMNFQTKLVKFIKGFGLEGWTNWVTLFNSLKSHAHIELVFDLIGSQYIE